MRVFHAGIFQDHAFGGDIVLRNGFERNGCEVSAFDFRAEIKRAGMVEANRQLLDRSVGFDVLLVGKGDGIHPQTLRQIRRRGTLVVLHYWDYRPVPPEWLKAILAETDVLFMTSGGDVLRTHASFMNGGVAAFFVSVFDPEAYAPTPVPASQRSGIVFTGTPYHFASRERKRIIRYLHNRDDVSIYGGAEYTRLFTGIRPLDLGILRLIRHLPTTYVRGEAYASAIMRARIGISVSATNTVQKYTSDRLSHYTGLGTLVLCERFPGLDELFEPDEVIRFSGVDELRCKIDYYHANEDERCHIEARGRDRTLRDYNPTAISAMMLDVIKDGNSDRFPWVEIRSGA